MAIEYAAKVQDPISHSNKEQGGWWGAGSGLAVGGTIAGILLLGSNPIGWVTAAGIAITGASTGLSVGKMIGSMSRDGKADGYVITGAKSTFIVDRLAAHITSKVDCHSPHFVVSGSKGVFIEGYNASRLGSRTSCAGYVAAGEFSVVYGDPEVYMPGHENPNEETSKLLYWTEKGLGIAGLAAGGASATTLLDKALVGAGALQNAADIAGVTGAGLAGNTLDAANTANGYLRPFTDGPKGSVRSW